MTGGIWMTARRYSFASIKAEPAELEELDMEF
jgi:hypothetical protein